MYAGCGWTIIALGKLGAEELNYSSDIDLLILHDLATAPLEQEQAQPFYVGLTRDLVRLLSRQQPMALAGVLTCDCDLILAPLPSVSMLMQQLAIMSRWPVHGSVPHSSARGLWQAMCKLPSDFCPKSSPLSGGARLITRSWTT